MKTLHTPPDTEKLMRIFLCDLTHEFKVPFGTVGNREQSRLMTFVVAPLNIASVAAYALSRFPGELNIQLFKSPTGILDALEAQEPTILGLSNYSWNQDINKHVIQFAKTRYPNLIVVLGGPCIQAEPLYIHRFLQNNRHVDAYVMFQGEWPFAEIIHAVKAFGPEFRTQNPVIANCAYLSGEQLKYHHSCEAKNLAELPSPYLTGLLDSFLKENFTPIFETNRGCPFRCTFCAWGASALNEIHQFPLTRVYQELDYVASRYPHCRAWVFADANFGILERDIDIAQMIASIRKRTPNLKEVRVWDAKNSPSRVARINRLMGNDTQEILLAVQTLNPAAQRAVKRGNITLDDLSSKIERYHDDGCRVITHVMAPLPEDSYEEQIDTLRKCFDLRFDGIYIMDPVLLPGTEMATPETRLRYGLKSKFQTRQYSYGEYRNRKSIECEEILVGTNRVSDDEYYRMKIIHWLIWYGWCYGHLKPILRCAQEEGDINPIDVIRRGVEVDMPRYRLVNDFFKSFVRFHEQQLFDSEASLKGFYRRDENWRVVKKDGVVKAAHLYNSIITNRHDIFQDLVDLLVGIIDGVAQTKTIHEVARLVLANRFSPEDLIRGQVPAEKKITIQSDILPYFSSIIDYLDYPPVNGESVLALNKPADNQQLIISEINKYGGEEDLCNAVERIIRNNTRLFTYQISLTQAI